jgi:hypothetical protein
MTFGSIKEDLQSGKWYRNSQSQLLTKNLIFLKGQNIMLRMKKNNNAALVMVVLMQLFAASCTKTAKNASEGSSDLLSVKGSEIEDLSSQLSTPDQVCSYLKEQKYYTGNKVSAGTEVAYSTSYKTDKVDSNAAEAGQAFGKVTDDGKFYQSDFVTKQILICPGATSGLYAGKCLWTINGDRGYLQLAYDVVCNKAANYGSRGRLHPGYTSMTVKKKSIVVNTAGKTFKHDDVVAVHLEGSNNQSDIYFQKGQGVAAIEFRGDESPSGTSKVYFAGSSGLGLTQ